MADCSKCLRTDIKCCFTCKKDADKCKVWHHCGSDCPEHESRIKTNADRIRAMNDEELAEFLEQIVSGNRNVIGINCGNSKCESWKCTECISMWLQSEAE